MQCSGSDPWHFDVDPDSDPEPAIFVIDLPDANKKQIYKKFFCLLLFEGTFTSFFKDKKSIRSHKTEGMIEGSGSGRPENMWTRWIRIRNTGTMYDILVLM